MFWFYIHGTGYVGLFVDIRLEYNLNSTLLHVDGQPKNKWTQATVSINSEQNYRVRLRNYLCMLRSSFNLDWQYQYQYQYLGESVTPFSLSFILIPNLKFLLFFKTMKL